MLRVSKVDEWLHRAPTRPDLSRRGDCVIIRASQGYDGMRGASLAPGVSNRSAGAQALRLHLVMIPARTTVRLPSPLPCQTSVSPLTA